MKDKIQRNAQGISALSFQSLVLGILDEIASQRKAIIQRHIFTKNRTVDITISKEIEELQAPIMVETLYRPTRERLQNRARALGNLAKVVGYSSILVIASSPLDGDLVYPLEEELSSRKVRVEIWDYRRLREVARRTRYRSVFKDSTYSYDELLKAELKHAVQDSTTDKWKQRTQESMDHLRQLHRERKVVLFLGAGTTFDASIPKWAEFIKRLVVRVIDEQGNAGLSQTTKEALAEQLLKEHLDWQLIGGHYVKTALEDNFQSTVADVLYDNIRHGIGGTSELLDSLADFCIRFKWKKPRTAIPAVVTYNFDDLLERHLDARALRFKIVRAPDDIPSAYELPIYHVHGCMPVGNRPGFQRDDEFVVLAEEDYQVLYQNPVYWANNVQLHYLRENSCLMIGLSLTDPNLRRLLWIVARESERARHYMLTKRNSAEEIVEGTNLNSSRIGGYLKLHYELQERAYRKIGVNIVWYEDHRRIPHIIRYIAGQF